MGLLRKPSITQILVVSYYFEGPRSFRRLSNDPCAPKVCSLHWAKDQAAFLLRKGTWMWFAWMQTYQPKVAMDAYLLNCSINCLVLWNIMQNVNQRQDVQLRHVSIITVAWRHRVVFLKVASQSSMFVTQVAKVIFVTSRAWSPLWPTGTISSDVLFGNNSE